MTNLGTIHDKGAEGYDREAKATGWHGPAVVFGLAFPFIHPGDTILDIGIGTGLGSLRFHKAGLRVYGLDTSTGMLEVCRKKGIASRLEHHDLTVVPYPYGDASCSHAVATGVFHFFKSLDPILSEVHRILADGGVFVFTTVDRCPDEPDSMVVGPEHTGTDESVIIYGHTIEQVTCWLEKNGLRLIDSLEFTVWMGSQRSAKVPARAYLAQKSRPASCHA